MGRGREAVNTGVGGAALYGAGKGLTSLIPGRAHFIPVTDDDAAQDALGDRRDVRVEDVGEEAIFTR